MGSKIAVNDGICKLVEAKWIFASSVQTEKNMRKIKVKGENLSCPADFPWIKVYIIDSAYKSLSFFFFFLSFKGICQIWCEM